MTICESCGHENADDVDFCKQCGAYLRWDPTRVDMPSVAPPAPDPRAGRPRPRARDAAPARPRLRDPEGRSPRPAQPPPPPADESAPAAISLRLPDDEPDAAAGDLAVGVDPGGRARVLAHVRNQGSIVDNYSLVLHGIPDAWYTIVPDTVYLVPFGSAGAYEQELEIHLHPPRSSEPQSRLWQLSVGVLSRAYREEVASAPMTLGIQPYEDYAIRVRPERASGRREVKYQIALTNSANAAVAVALDAVDSDGACEFRFDRDVVELAPAETKTVPLHCRPPRQIWLGRPVEHRLQIHSATGEEGEQLLQDKAARAPVASGGGVASRLGGAGMPRLPGVRGPRVGMPDVSIGPGGGLDVRMPHVRGPQFGGVNLGRRALDLNRLRLPNAGPATPAAPLLPTQAVFRQKAWLPWWLAIVAPLVLTFGIMLFLLLPKNVDVPSVVGAKTVFEAERKLDGAGLELKGTTNRVTSKATAGTVLAQSPDPGESIEKGSSVTLEVAVSNGATTVPDLAGLTLPEADKALREKGLQKGSLSAQPPDPGLKIASTIPAAGERVKRGTPIDIFYPNPDAAAGGSAAGGEQVTVPEVSGDQQAYAAALSEAGFVPGEPELRISEQPKGTVIGTDPPAGEKAPKGATVSMLVAVPFPRMAYDANGNVALADTESGDRVTPAVAKQPGVSEKDPTWAPGNQSIVYTAGGRLFSTSPPGSGRDRTPVALRPAGESYADPSFAPLAMGRFLAVSRVNPTGDRDLCLGVAEGDFKPDCIADASFSTGFAHWSPDGKTILVPATSDKGPGIVRYTSKTALSTTASDWGKGEFVTEQSPGKGVIDAAISPNGKRLAVIAKLDTPVAQLYLTTPDDLGLKQAKPVEIGACKVAWLDSQILALVQLGDDCSQGTGEILRIDVDKPSEGVAIATAGDNPTFEPLSAGG